nr:hypothetical protein [Lysinibacillus timonensis]
MIPDINLIPKLEKEQSTSRVVYIILGVIVVVALGILAWQYMSANNQIASLQSQQTTLQQQRDLLQADLTNLNSVNVTSIEETVEYIDLVSYPVLPLIMEIEGLQPNNSYLRQYSFGVDSISITMDFETLSDVSDFVSRISNSEFFVDGQLTNVSQFTLGEGETEGDFNVIPRHTANLTLMIDELYLAMGGIQ